MVRGREMDGSPSSNIGVRKGTWTKEEDLLLKQCIHKYGEGNWHQVPRRAGLNRCRKSCRLRWLNYLRPNIKRGDFTTDEIDLIIRLHKLLGNRWSLIAGRLPGRTANDIKNYWNTHRVKKVLSKKIDGTYERTTVTTTINTIVIKPQPRTLMKPSLKPTMKEPQAGEKPCRAVTPAEEGGPWWDWLLQDMEKDKDFWINSNGSELGFGLGAWDDMFEGPAILNEVQNFQAGPHEGDWEGLFVDVEPLESCEPTPDWDIRW
ncbi:hypothetical protein Ancab_006432 [Ancistrocladus abbreviatus]